MNNQLAKTVSRVQNSIAPAPIACTSTYAFVPCLAAPAMMPVSVDTLYGLAWQAAKISAANQRFIRAQTQSN